MNGNSYRDYDRGTSGAKVCTRPVKVPSNQRYMFLDLTQPVRAIYIPRKPKGGRKIQGFRILPHDRFHKA